MLWFEVCPSNLGSSIAHQQASSFDALISTLEHANELDALVVNMTSLSAYQQSILAKLLQEQSHIEVFVSGELPDMHFSLADFHYERALNQLMPHLRRWVEQLQQDYAAWLAARPLLLYADDGSIGQQLSDLGFTNQSLLAEQTSERIEQFNRHLGVVVNFKDTDKGIVALLESISAASNSPWLVLCHQANSRLLPAVKRLIKRLNINLFSVTAVDNFASFARSATPVIFRLYRNRLRKLGQSQEHANYRIFGLSDDAPIGLWDAPLSSWQGDDLFAIHWQRYQGLDASEQGQLKQFANKVLLVFQGRFPIERIAELIKLQQQGLRLVWEPRNHTEVANQLDSVELFEYVAVSIDLWQQLNLNLNRKQLLEQLKQACALAGVNLGVVAANSELKSYWGDRGFHYVIGKPKEEED